MDFLRHLEADYRRLAEVCAGGSARRVPTCPEWTVDDLMRHVALVYLHKVECMRLGAHPEPWPPDLSGESAPALLDRAHAALAGEFAARAPSSSAYTWFGPDQTVGFWQRRMAHETVIHRIDGELAAGAESLPVPDELALDGIDEILRIFLAWQCVQWPEDFADALSAGPGAVAIVATPAQEADQPITSPEDPAVAHFPDAHPTATPPGTSSPRWRVTWDGKTVDVTGGSDADGPAAAEISGTPEAILRWLWRRADSGVAVAGDKSQVAQMRQLLAAATQ